MDHRVEAIFEDGVFKPLGEVTLPDHLRVVLRIENGNLSPVEADAEAVALQKCAKASLDAELAQIPDNSPDDGLSGDDHDRILYGGQR